MSSKSARPSPRNLLNRKKCDKCEGIQRKKMRIGVNMVSGALVDWRNPGFWSPGCHVDGERRRDLATIKTLPFSMHVSPRTDLPRGTGHLLTNHPRLTRTDRPRLAPEPSTWGYGQLAPGSRAGQPPWPSHRWARGCQCARRSGRPPCCHRRTPGHPRSVRSPVRSVGERTNVTCSTEPWTEEAINSLIYAGKM